MSDDTREPEAAGPDFSRSLEELDLRTAAREERELKEEMNAHFLHRVDELIEEGHSEEEALRLARDAFGDFDRIATQVGVERNRTRRRRQRADVVGDLLQDLRYALRQLRRGPSFSLIAIATLALGIGGGVTIFGVVRSVVLEPLPFTDPDGLVELAMLTPAGDPFSVAEPGFIDWRERTRQFAGVAAYTGAASNLQSPGQPRSIARQRVSANIFEVMGAPPILGRSFRPEEDLPGDPARVAMISEDLWRNAMGADPGVLDRSLVMDGESWPIVGVYPRGAELILGTDGVATPLGADPAYDRGEHYLGVIARLAPGATDETARADLAEVMAWQSSTYIEDREWRSTLEPLEDVLIGASTIRAGWVLLAAGGLLLLTAIVNVSSLLLVRATVRATEMKVRRALGAATGRLGRQLFTESAVLSLLGGVAGLLFASVALPMVRRLATGRILRIEQAALDPTTTGVALLAVLVAAGAFGLAPIGIVRARTSLRTRGRGSGEGGRRARTVLVGVQVAISVVLLIGTGLLFRSFTGLARVDVGFESRDAWAFDVSLPGETWPWEERNQVMNEILTAVEAIPGVRIAAATAVDPFSGFSLANNVAPADDMPAEAVDFPPVAWRAVTSGYFEALGVPLVAGRAFVDSDILPRTEASWGQRPVVIDDRLARDFFGSPSDAIGKRIVWGNPDGSHLTVVGVAATIRDVVLDEEPDRMVYRLYGDLPWSSMVGVARIEREIPGIELAIRQAVLGAAPGIGAPEIERFEARVDRALAEPRFNVLLLAGFAISGLALALIGLYGSTAFEVRQRFREIGIRISLGADAESIQRLFVRERLTLAAVGIVAGCVAAFLLRGTLDSLLFGVASNDPITWGVGIALVLATALVAAWLPARRATKVDPAEVLGAE